MALELPHIIAFDTLLGIGGHMTSSLLEPVFRDAGYRANATLTRSTPPPDSILRSYWASRFGTPGRENAEFIKVQGLLEHGVDSDISTSDNLEVKARLDIRARLWEEHLAMSRPYLPLEMWLQAWIFSMLEQNASTANGFDAAFTAQLKRNGLFDDIQQNIVKYLPEKITKEQLFVLRNRELITDKDFDTLLVYEGQRDKALRNTLKELRFEIPGPSDLTRFAVRHVFEPSLATQYGFDEEISQDFLKWHTAQGMGKEFNITDPVTGEVFPMTWGKAQWWSHWVWPSPTQAYTMLQRLRTTGGQNGGPRDTSGLTFTSNDLNLLLRGNDYPKHWRPRLAAISYRVLETAEIKQGWQLGVFDDNESVERYQDAGYTKENSQIKLKINQEEIKWRRIEKTVARMRFKLLQTYRDGILIRSDAARLVYQLGLPTYNAWKTFSDLPQEEQNSIAAADETTTAVLNAVDADFQVKIAREAISAIHKGFLRFELDRNGAEQALRSIGVTSTRATQYLDKWQWEFYGRGKSLAVGQITKSIVRGVLTPANAILRLRLLGYPQIDAVALVQLAMQDQTLYLARAQAASARTLKAQQKALITQQKELQKSLQKVRREMASSASKAKMMKWLEKGYIDQETFNLRMQILGVEPVDIPRYEREAHDTKGSKAPEATPIPPEETLPSTLP